MKTAAASGGRTVTETSAADIELEGVTGVRHTYTSGPNGSPISVKIRNVPGDIDGEPLELRFDEPEGAEVHEVSAAFEDDDSWELVQTGYPGNRHVTFRVRRDGTREEIQEQELGVSLHQGEECLDTLTFTIYG